MGPNPSTMSPEYLHETSGPNANVIIITCFALAVVAVPLRLAARKAIKTPLWWDDYLIILALVCVQNFKVYKRLALTSSFRR